MALLRARSTTIDGEAVVCCPKTGLSMFDRLHSGQHDGEVVLYAFDLIELNGADLRPRPLEERKAKLAALRRMEILTSSRAGQEQQTWWE